MSGFAIMTRHVQLSTITRMGRQQGTAFLATLVMCLSATLLSVAVVLWASLSFSAISSTLVSMFVPDSKVVVAGAFAAGKVPSALRVIRTEQEQVEQEQASFTDFAEEIRSFSPGGQSAMGTNAHSVNTANGNRVLRRVRDLYRETVMSTPGFDSAYGESFEEHVSREFGEDVAALLLEGHTLTEPGKQVLIQQAEQSASHRELLLDGLLVEERSLEQATSTLESVRDTLEFAERADFSTLSLSQLATLDTELESCRNECLDLLQSRQEQIHTVNRRMHGPSKTLTQEYLYSDLPMSFPALSAVLECLRAIDRLRSRIVDSACLAA